MKKFAFLFVMMLGVSFEIIAQDTVTRKEFEELKNRLAKFESDATEDVGILQLKKCSIEKGVDIDSVMITIKDGYISEILFICSNKELYTNLDAPIGLTLKRFSKKDNIVSTAKSSKKIVLQHYINYIPKTGYIPDDGNMVLKCNSNLSLKKGIGLNTVMDIRLYSDLLGAFGNQSNGLVQTEGYIKQILHRSNIRNRGIFLVNYVKANFVLSKFDSKVAYVDSAKMSRSALLQSASFNASLSFNLFNMWLGKKSPNYFYTDLGFGINSSNLKRKKDSISVITNNFFLETGLDLQISSNAGMQISTKAIWQYSYQTDFAGNGGERLFINPAFNVYWNPQKNSASRLFGRVNYFIDTKDKPNAFLQVQVGYALRLTDVGKNNK